MKAFFVTVLLTLCVMKACGLMCPPVFDDGNGKQYCADCSEFSKPQCCSVDGTCDENCENCVDSWHCHEAPANKKCGVSVFHFPTQT